MISGQVFQLLTAAVPHAGEEKMILPRTAGQRHDNAVRSTASHSRGRAGLIVHFVCQMKNLLAQRGTYTGLSVKCPVHRAGRHTGRSGHIVNGNVFFHRQNLPCSLICIIESISEHVKVKMGIMHNFRFINIEF